MTENGITIYHEYNNNNNNNNNKCCYNAMPFRMEKNVYC